MLLDTKKHNFGLRVKGLFVRFQSILNFPRQIFMKTPKQTSRRSVRCEPRWYLRSDRQTW